MARERPIDISLGDELPTGQRIRLRRHYRGVSLTTMAVTIEYNKGYLSHVEGGRSNPSEQLLTKLADYLETTAQALREGPLSQLTGGLPPEQFASRSSTLGLSAELSRPRLTVGQRVTRILTMGHLTQQEEEAIVEKLVRETSALVDFAKSLREPN